MPDLDPPGDHRGTQAEQEIAHDRAGERRLDDIDQPPMQGEQRDDDLGGVAQGRVQQAPQGRPERLRQGLGRIAHQPGERYDRQRRGEEHQDRVSPHPVECDRDGDEHQQPVSLHLDDSVRSVPSHRGVANALQDHTRDRVV